MTDTAFTHYDAPTFEAGEQDTASAPALTAELATNADLQEIPVASIRVDAAFNPRKRFVDAEIAEFAERIRATGWLSPPLVRPDPYGDGFMLVAGERRLRAIRHLGWTTVQVTVKAMDDVEHRKLALTENVDRKDLTVAEEALAARDHLDAYEGDHDAAANALGWPVARLRHRLKLLHASSTVIEALLSGQIQLGHAELLATLPKDNQDKALPRVIADAITVAGLREQINGFVTPLASAIFDTSGCANCVFNTSCQGTLFEARVDEGNCTNKPCFREKTERSLDEKRVALKSDFGTVVLVSEKAPEQSVPLVKHGPTGVGPVQFDACRTCQFRGAAIHDAPGARLGSVDSPLCFNTSCHTQHVQAYAAQLQQDQDQEQAQSTGDSTPAPASGTTSSQPAATKAKSKVVKAKPKAKAVLRSVTEQYGEIIARAGAEALSRQATPALALAVHALLRTATDECHADRSALLEGLGLPDLGTYQDNADVAALAACDADTLNAAIQAIAARILTTKVNERPHGGRLQRRALLPILTERAGIDPAAHARVDEAFLAAHTKPAIEAVLDESGFKAWIEQQEDGAKKYKALLASKKDDLVEKVLQSGYGFPDYLPGGYADAIKTWQKEAGVKAAPPSPVA